MLKKYALTSDRIRYRRDLMLYRIIALRDFGNVKTHELGGYVEDESNLSHEGDCWIGENAKVFDHATVTGSAFVYGNAVVYQGAQITDHARVCEKAEICGGARIGENLTICGSAYVYGDDGDEAGGVDE